MMRRWLAQGWGDEGGITLVELLMIMLITAIIGTLAVSSTVSMLQTQRTMQAMQDSLDESRLALDTIRKDVRGARRVFEDDTGRHLQFWIDRDDNEDISLDEVVNYAIVDGTDGARLERWTEDAPDQRRVLARNLVSNEPFTYTPEAPGTRRVSITLIVDIDSAEVDPVTVTADVRLRNVT